MSGSLWFSAVFRFSIYGIEPAEAVARFGPNLETVLALAEASDWVLTKLSFCRICVPPVWSASFSIRKSFSMAAEASTPFEAVLGALWIAHAHADWIDANPQPSRHAAVAPRPAPSRRPAPDRLTAAEKASIFNDLFKE